MEYKCEICGEKIVGNSIVYINHTENHIIDMIKQDHPEWKDKNGMCQKCLEHFRNQLKGQ